MSTGCCAIYLAYYTVQSQSDVFTAPGSNQLICIQYIECACLILNHDGIRFVRWYGMMNFTGARSRMSRLAIDMALKKRIHSSSQLPISFYEIVTSHPERKYSTTSLCRGLSSLDTLSQCVHRSRQNRAEEPRQAAGPRARRRQRVSF